MTRKRFVKLLMAKGISKKMAEEKAIICSMALGSYSKSYNYHNLAFLQLFHKRLFNINREKIRKFKENSLQNQYKTDTKTYTFTANVESE